MRSLMIAGMAAGAVALASPSVAAEGRTGRPVIQRMPPTVLSAPTHRWGHRMDGRWRAGHDAPGGWAAYRAPVRGYALPRYWIQPGFYIADHGAYGLPVPQYGYGWSRYYDDAVLTDQYGRVYDSRSGIAWDRYEGGYAPDIPQERLAEAPPHSPQPPRAPPPGRMPYDDHVTSSNEYPAQAEYRGQWRGTWRGDDGRVYSGTYEGTYNGTADAAPPPYAGPHWMSGADYGYGPDARVYYAAPGTTIVIEPGTTTTTTTTEEEIVPVRRTWRRAGKTVRCNC